MEVKTTGCTNCINHLMKWDFVPIFWRVKLFSLLNSMVVSGIIIECWELVNVHLCQSWVQREICRRQHANKQSFNKYSGDFSPEAGSKWQGKVVIVFRQFLKVWQVRVDTFANSLLKKRKVVCHSEGNEESDANIKNDVCAAMVLSYTLINQILRSSGWQVKG